MSRVSTRAGTGGRVNRLTEDEPDLLEQMAASTPKKSGKAEKPVAMDKGLADLIEKFEEAKAQAAKYQSLADTYESQILEAGREHWLKACRSGGKVESSIKLNNRLTFTQKCQYSKINPAAMEALNEAFGSAADDYFVTHWEIGLTDQAAADKNIVNNIIKLVGPENFKTWFSAKKEILVSAAFHNDFVLKPAVQKKAEPFLADQTIKPYKPTLR